MNMVEEIYKLNGQIPKHKLYGLTSQIRRSAVSIPSNIAEGTTRNSKKEFLQFSYVALGSLTVILKFFWDFFFPLSFFLFLPISPSPPLPLENRGQFFILEILYLNLLNYS